MTPTESEKRATRMLLECFLVFVFVFLIPIEKGK